MSAVLFLVSVITATPEPAWQGLPWAAATNASAAALFRQLECADTSGGCAAWAGAGECSTNPGFMHSACPLACRRCTPTLSGDDAAKSIEVCCFAARNLMGLNHASWFSMAPIKTRALSDQTRYQSRGMSSQTLALSLGGIAAG